jgi:hypothetical protein
MIPNSESEAPVIFVRFRKIAKCTGASEHALRGWLKISGIRRNRKGEYPVLPVIDLLREHHVAVTQERLTAPDEPSVVPNFSVDHFFDAPELDVSLIAEDV